MVPRCASSNCPSFRRCAPVNAPFSCPKSSDSRSPGGIAAQLTLTNGALRRADAAWIARATTSLPTPLSPRIRTVASVSATLTTTVRIARISRLPSRSGSSSTRSSWSMLTDTSYKPVALDHVNIFVRNAEQSHRWYTDILGLHTQDTMYFKDTGKLRAVFLACDPAHAHDVALFEVGEDAPGPQKRQVGLNHFAWRMGSVDDLKEIYLRLKAKGVPVSVSDHTVSIGVYFSDPDGNGLEVYYELPRTEWRRDRPFSGAGDKGRFPGPWDEVIP